MEVEGMVAPTQAAEGTRFFNGMPQGCHRLEGLSSPAKPAEELREDPETGAAPLEDLEDELVPQQGAAPREDLEDGLAPQPSASHGTTLGDGSVSRASQELTSHLTGGSDSPAIRSISTFRRVSTDDLGPKLRKSLVFKDSEKDLLRAVSLDNILRGHCGLLRSAKGSQATYDLSYPVVGIKHFISHNWSVSRRNKYLCLALHFNRWPARWATILASAVAIGLTLTGVMPTIEDSHYTSGTAGIACRIVCIPTYLLVSLWWRDLSTLLRLPSPSAFLDKVCIHQTDSQRQGAGIAKLGAFLRSSEDMIVLYSGVYLQKLWTVYELASFLVLKPVDRLHVIPVRAPLVTIGMLLNFYAANLLPLVSEWIMTFSDLAVVVLTYVFVVMCRAWAKELVYIQEHLSRFSCDACICAREEDRPHIYGNITDMMKASECAAEEATETECLQAFEHLVEQHMSSALNASFGRVGINYSVALTISILGTIPRFIDFICVGPPLEEMACEGMLAFASAFGGSPVCIAFVMSMAKCFCGLRGCADYMYCFLIWFCSILSFMALAVVLKELKGAAGESSLWLLLFALFCSALAGAGPLAFGVLHRPRCRSRQDRCAK